MLKTLSQLACVITLPYSVVTESSFVMIEFIYYLHFFMLRQSKDCCDKVPLPFAFINVAIGIKSVVTVFLTHFFSSLVTKKLFVTTKFYFFIEFSLDFVAT